MYARTPESLRLLWNSQCTPTPQKAGAAARFFERTPEVYVPVRVAPAAVEEAMEGVGMDPAPPPPLPRGDAGRAAVGREVERYRELGHEAELNGRVIICSACGAFVVDQGRNAKLSAVCLGPSKVGSTRANEKAQVSRARQGLHPRTRVALPVLPRPGERAPAPAP